MPLNLLPAIDIANRRAVQLGHNATDDQTSYGDPMEIARAWVQEGVEWLHFVDLDAAFRRGNNAALITKTISDLDVRVELSADVCDDESLRWALSTGAERIILGSAALADLDWCLTACAAHGERLAVGLDIRGDRIAPRAASSRLGNVDLFQVLDRFDEVGCRRYVVTDVTRDGALAGPNLTLLLQVCGRTDRPVIASGGVSGLDDLRQLAALEPAGVEGVIVGRALHVGAFTVSSALAALQEGDRPGSRVGRE